MAYAMAPCLICLGHLDPVSLLRQEVLVHVVDVVAGEFSLEVAVLAEGTDEAAAVDAAPVLHIPGELIVIVMLQLIEVQVHLTVLVLNVIDEKVLLLFVFEILDLIVNSNRHTSIRPFPGN